MSDLRITAGPYEFLARWEREKSPQTCAAFEALLPYRQKIIHVRWSGESCWIPLGDYDLGVGFEDATSVPQAGEILFDPGGYWRRRSCSLTRALSSRASWVSSPATTSSPWSKAGKTCVPWAS